MIMLRPIATVLVLLLGGFTAEHVRAADQEAPSQTGSESRIRNARMQFNAAIAARDLAAIEEVLAPSYHIVTGRSAQSQGAVVEVDSWRETFSADPSFACERTPDQIVVNEDWGLAQELGRWVCNYTADGEPVRSNGVYSAKWQRTEKEKWVLQAEIFTTMECRGPAKGCRAPDPIE